MEPVESVSDSTTDETFHRRALLSVETTISTLRRQITTDDLLRHGGIMSVATIASGALNYAYQVFMGRALGPEQYGVFGAVFALLYLVNVLGAGVRFSATRFTSEFDIRIHSLGAFFRGWLARVGAFGVAIVAAIALVSPQIGSFLGVNAPILVTLVGVNGLCVLVLSANMGSLQGLQRFKTLGAYRLALAAVKLVFGVALVALGFGVYGAIGAIVLSSAVVLGATTVHLYARTVSPDREDVEFDYRRAYNYVTPAVLAGFCFTVPATVDVIIVKHFFSSHQAGLYTAATVLGKILLFLPMGITAALFPKVSYGESVGEDTRLDSLFDRALLYSAAVASAGTLAYWTAPRTILELVFGTAYVDAAPLLRWYGLATLLFVLAVVVLNFQLARNQNGFVYVFTALTGVEILLMWTVHASMVGIIQVILLVNAALFVYGLVVVKK